MPGVAPTFYRVSIDPANRMVTYNTNYRYSAAGDIYLPIYENAVDNDTLVNQQASEITSPPPVLMKMKQ